MSFGSKIKMSLHNLKNNKLRTLLTVLVLFIMATIVMVLAGFGMGFVNSMNANNSVMMSKDTSRVVISEYVLQGQDGDMNNYTNSHNLGFDKVESYMEFYNGDENIFSSVEFRSSYECRLTIDGSYNSLYPIPVDFNSNQFVGSDRYLIGGRMWDSSDIATNNVWLTYELSTEYELGDKLKFAGRSEEFVVQGFLNGVDKWGSYDSNSIYIDYNKFSDDVPKLGVQNNSNWEEEQAKYLGKLSISNVTFNIVPADGVEFGSTTANKLKAFIDTYDELEKATGDIGISVYSDLVGTLNMSFYMTLGIGVGVLFFATIIILLSIGSVSNTIKITVEQNRKFFGMMKAIGMQNKTVRSIVKIQAVVMVLIGVLLATGVTIGVMFGIDAILALLMTTLFQEAAIVLGGLPFYVPIITFVMLVGFVLLFTRSSLMKISRMDVISVISEVN